MTGKLETQVLKEIYRVLGQKTWLRIWRNNSGAQVTDQRFVKFGLTGQADLTGILWDGTRLEIEVKRERGGKQSEPQKRFQAMIEKNNGIYILARSVEDVEAGLKQHEKWREG